MTEDTIEKDIYSAALQETGDSYVARALSRKMHDYVTGMGDVSEFKTSQVVDAVLRQFTTYKTPSLITQVSESGSEDEEDITRDLKKTAKTRAISKSAGSTPPLNGDEFVSDDEIELISDEKPEEAAAEEKDRSEKAPADAAVSKNSEKPAPPAEPLSLKMLNKFLWHAASLFIHALVGVAALITMTFLQQAIIGEKDDFLHFNSTLQLSETTGKAKFATGLSSSIFKNSMTSTTDSVLTDPIDVSDTPEFIEPEEFDIEPGDFTDPGENIDVGKREIIALPFGISGEGAGSLANSGGSFELPPGRIRDQNERLAVVRENGGDAKTEAAVIRALEWFARHQHENGSWSTNFMREGTGECGDPICEKEHDAGLTGLALLCFLTAGYGDSGGKFASTVKSGLEYLTNLQYDGRFSLDMFNHALATAAIAEAFRVTANTTYGHSMLQALDSIYYSQNDDGGWSDLVNRAGSGTNIPNMDEDEIPSRFESDTLNTGWVVLALKTCADAGEKIDRNCRRGIRKWFKLATDDDVFVVRFRPDQVGGTIQLTSIGLVCGIFFDEKRNDKKFTQQAAISFDNLPEWGAGEHDFFYWHYATIGMAQVGGQYWGRWNAHIKKALIAGQEYEGDNEGSWPIDNSAFGKEYSRVFTTAMACLSLEIYYRYSRVYQPK